VQYDTPLHLLTNPGDAFVARLLGADDVLRRLSLIPAGAAMDQVSGPPPAGRPLAPGDSLRHALNILLGEGPEALPVRDAQGALLGRVTLDTVRRYAEAPTPLPERP
jgi:osmoprotectant transport system ATP-binding protein